jgi:hypothetical protein
MEKVKKKLSSIIKSDEIKSKIIPYSFSLFSIVFVAYILVNVINHFLSKYVF